MPSVHDFHERRIFSERCSELPFWEEVYRRAFPNFAGMALVRGDGWGQRSGVDRVITLNSSKTIAVDEKIREKAWPDFCLERWSDRTMKTPGWMQKPLACDFIAYGWLPLQTCYLLPTESLQRAWRLHGREWIDQYQIIHAQNNGYVTESVCVPIDVVLAAINDAMRVTWGNPPASRQPPPTQQLGFGFDREAAQ